MLCSQHLKYIETEVVILFTRAKHQSPSNSELSGTTDNNIYLYVQLPFSRAVQRKL